MPFVLRRKTPRHRSPTPIYDAKLLAATSSLCFLYLNACSSSRPQATHGPEDLSDDPDEYDYFDCTGDLEQAALLESVDLRARWCVRWVARVGTGNMGETRTLFRVERGV
ncbi:hypothetical protein U9M48_025116 [Paspalum notatum var. saurae]|uniref:Uncharacterized protein n=1 Tax=Paspalum notatum var. saurae TaxID=547442 RepID=A0AAQ3TSM4_PASNO